MFESIKEEIEAVKMRDPAARSTAEILLCYPGLWAILFHKLDYWLWIHNHKLSARFVSNLSRFITGIEYHPGAKFGKRVFIDHGMGIVVGETTEVGDDVLLYQGVVLGGVSLNKGKRHPTVGNKVVIGSGAKVLGNITLGDNCKIGAGSVVLRDVPSGTTAVGVPCRIVQEKKEYKLDLDHNLPDPVAAAINTILERQDAMEKQIDLLSEKLDVPKEELIDDSQIEEIFKNFNFEVLDNYSKKE